MLYSTRNRDTRATWREAVLSGIAPDGGLYLPIEIPKLQANEVAAYKDASFGELANMLANLFIGSEVARNDLERICHTAFNFPLTLKQLNDDLSILELFHGPTCAFKDFGARFMAGLFRHFWGAQDQQLTVLVATSGDTGSAVANAFFDTTPQPAIRVAILYPKGKVSDVQRRQMTTLGANVTAYEVDGTFDDCQALAKQALCDSDLIQRTPLTSANSINIARLLPQMFYYAHTTLRFSPDLPPIFSVPSGNLGNVTGGILAHLSGFQAGHFIAACNSNETFPRFLDTKVFTPKRSIETISNAMDVGNPSNFYRITELLEPSLTTTASDQLLSGDSVTDSETRDTLRLFHSTYGYVLDPHTAVGAFSLSRYKARNLHRSNPGVLVATAHPAKFAGVVENTLGTPPPIPTPLSEVLGKREQFIRLANSYRDLKEALAK